MINFATFGLSLLFNIAVALLIIRGVYYPARRDKDCALAEGSSETAFNHALEELVAHTYARRDAVEAYLATQRERLSQESRSRASVALQTISLLRVPEARGRGEPHPG